MNFEQEIGFVAPQDRDPAHSWNCKFGTEVTPMKNEHVGTL
jgi:hypothetical protein